MRMFVALELPDGLKAEIADLSRTLSRGCGGRFVDHEGYHLTLAFLGVIDEMGVALAADALDEACIGMAPVRLVPNGLGKFGSSRDATLWLGFVPEPELVGLFGRVRDGLRVRGLPFDEKPFSPHVTLARHACLSEGTLSVTSLPAETDAACVTLFRSTLSPDGPIYTPLHTVGWE